MSYDGQGQRQAPDDYAPDELARPGARNACPPPRIHYELERLEERTDLSLEEWEEEIAAIRGAPPYFHDRVPEGFTLEDPGSDAKKQVMRSRIKAGNRTDHPLDRHLTPDRDAYRDQLRRAFLEMIGGAA